MTSLDKSPMLHTVHNFTRYPAANWLQSVRNEFIWRAVRLACIDIYLDFPDPIVTNTAQQLLPMPFAPAPLYTSLTQMMFFARHYLH